MSKSEARIKEVISFYKNKDTVLGYRKLMDCVIDTQDLNLYRQVIDLTDWKAKHAENESEFIEKSLAILDQVSKIEIKEYNTNNPVAIGNNLTKSYGYNRFQLGPISVKINKGQVYGLVGENGNGKTTLLRILAKELKHNNGQLDFKFDNIYHSDYDLRTNLVYIPQRTQKWYGSLKDNLKFVLSSYDISPEENEIRVLMMIARFGLWNYKHLKWNELSSGYKMRFELARTLYLKDGKYKDNKTKNTTEAQQLIVEIDCTANRDTLLSIFENLQLDKLIYNGGIFVAYFNQSTNFSVVLEALGKHKIEVKYIRNITTSTRRFFVS